MKSRRGYPIEQLAERSSFLETAYLLIYGSLPSKSQYALFESEVMHHSIAHSDAEGLFRAFRSDSSRPESRQVCRRPDPLLNLNRYDAHPMSILTSAIASLGSMYSEVSVWLFFCDSGSCTVSDALLFSLGKPISSRPNALHKRGCGLAREHGQANLQAHREGNDLSCVSRPASMLSKADWTR